MKLDELFQYIKTNDLLSDYEIRMVQTCLDDIREMSPVDKPSIFRKSEKIINDSEDLSWCIYSLKQKYSQLQKDYRVKKDPMIGRLVLQKRPSMEAMNCEVRSLNPFIYDMEEELATVEHIIEYLNHIQLSLERYSYLLKDKLKYD